MGIQINSNKNCFIFYHYFYKPCLFLAEDSPIISLHSCEWTSYLYICHMLKMVVKMQVTSYGILIMEVAYIINICIYKYDIFQMRGMPSFPFFKQLWVFRGGPPAPTMASRAPLYGNHPDVLDKGNTFNIIFLDYSFVHSFQYGVTNFIVVVIWYSFREIGGNNSCFAKR